MTKANSKLIFSNGSIMNNRFSLAPLTNTQSHDNGQLASDELKWLSMRAEGGFGLVMTCASHVQEIGKGFLGQLGIFNDSLIEGHIELVKSLKKHGSLAVIQLHHAGMRTPTELINEQPVCPSDNEETNSRALTLDEVKQLRDDFISAAFRSQKCGYDGVEIHGAHGYILSQFLSSEINNRTDEYGGSLPNRSRLIFEIIDGIRKQCGKDFLVGIRFSPERFGMDLAEVKFVCRRIIDEGNIDFLDISLWDCFKMPEEEKYQNITLLQHFSSLDFKKVKWTVAGKISNAADVQKILDSGVDFVSIGTSGILHHNFPNLVMENSVFEPIALPASVEHLKEEGLGEKFITYLRKRPGFVK